MSREPSETVAHDQKTERFLAFLRSLSDREYYIVTGRMLDAWYNAAPKRPIPESMIRIREATQEILDKHSGKKNG